MSKKIMVAALMGAMALPAAAQAQSRVNIPQVELFATVTGKWVLDPRRCRDIREDVRDARTTHNRRDRREDRRDQRVADCPASAYDFVVAPGQGPKYPVRVGRGRVDRQYRGRPMFINGDTIGANGLPVSGGGQAYAPQPVYPQPTYQQPAYQQPAYQQPIYQTQPSYQPAPNTTYQNGQPTYTAPAPTYTQPVPSQPSNYRIENGVIIFE